MTLYNRCINEITETRYVGSYQSISRYRCSNKTFNAYCPMCEESKKGRLHNDYLHKI